jgi:hypothetical protein
MADYDSDSSGAEDIETGVTLGYATKDATGDDFSQLGGYPVSLSTSNPYKTNTNNPPSLGSTRLQSPPVPSPNAKSAPATSPSSSN